ncbi:MAG: hypothetical protein LEGION0403_FIIPPAGN_00853 [Legionella sp.]
MTEQSIGSEDYKSRLTPLIIIQNKFIHFPSETTWLTTIQISFNALTSRLRTL